MDAEKRDSFLAELAELCRKHEIAIKADADDGGGASRLFLSLDEWYPQDIHLEVSRMLDEIA